jgi:DNA-binding MarR family transcriptional regulator
MAKLSSLSVKPIIDVLGKRLSTATVMFHAAIAQRMGVSITDAKCRSILLQVGPMTAGELAERVGVTTGAVTGIIDRLVNARLVRRSADRSDRRRVIVEPVSNRDKDIARLFEPMGKRIVDLAAALSEEQRRTIFEFLTKASEILEEEATRLRAKR